MTASKRSQAARIAAQGRRLRVAAELRAASEPAGAAPARAAAELSHELHVHRIELEMQNEQLRQAQVALEAARDRYIDLYDFAPVGYLTLDTQGLITEANLTCAQLLGVERRRLVGSRFARHVAPDDRDRWYRHALALGQHAEPGRIELALLRSDGPTFHAQLDAVPARTPGAEPALRLALSDISVRKRAELYRRRASAANAGREADRRHLALELHENLGQRLCAVKMDLDELHHAESEPARRQRIGAMLGELELAVAMVRRMSAELRPSMLDNLGLTAAIDWLVRATAERLGTAVTLEQDSIEPPLEPASAVAVYRLVQDVLSQLAAMHPLGDAGLSVRRQALELVISLQATAAIEGGGESAGQTSALRESANALGGQLALESEARGRTRIVVRVPIEPVQGGHHLRLAEALG